MFLGWKILCISFSMKSLVIVLAYFQKGYIFVRNDAGVPSVRTTGAMVTVPGSSERYFVSKILP